MVGKARLQYRYNLQNQLNVGKGEYDRLRYQSTLENQFPAGNGVQSTAVSIYTAKAAPCR